MCRPADCLAAATLPFKGQIDFDQQSLLLEVFVQDNPSTLIVQMGQDGLTKFTLNVKNQETSLGNVSTFLEGQFQLSNGQLAEGPGLTGTLQSRYTLINHKPGGDFEASLHLTRDRLIIRSLTSKDIQIQGDIRINAPYDLDLRLGITALNINPLLKVVQEDESRTVFGPFEGNLRITGIAQRIEIKGRLLTFNGVIDGVDYQDMLLNFEGLYPLVRIEDSHIIQPDGTIFKIAGNLDLSRMTDFDQQLQRFISKPLIHQNGQELEWTLKRLHQNGSNATSELKYLYRKEKSSHPSSGQEGVIFGLERQHRF